jgi:hypothetical protein
MSELAPRSREPKPLAAGAFQPEISSFRLCLAAEGKAAKTVRMYTEAVQWFAAAHLIPQTSRARWEQVSGQDIQRWMVWLLSRYSDSYASNQYRALQQFFKWWAAEEDLPDPMARLRPPKVTEKLIPVFTSGELSKLEKACAGRSFAQRRDLAVIAVFKATGMRLSELAGILYDPEDTQRSDVDLWQREITVRGQGRQGTDRPDQPPDRRHPRPLYPGPGPARSGVPTAVVAGGQQPGPDDGQRHLPDDCPPRPPEWGGRSPAPVRRHFSHTWLDRGGAEGDLMELNGWTSPQMLRRYGASACSTRAHRSYDRIMDPLT